MSVSQLRSDPILARALPFFLFIAFLIAGSWIAPWTEQFGITAAWLAIARGIIVALALAWFWKAYVELHDAPSASLLQWLAALGVGLVVFLAWITLGQAGAEGEHSGRFTPLLTDGSLDWPMAMLRLAGLALVVPIMEELFWRSLVLRWIDRHDFLALPPRQVGLGAFAIATALFAVEHDQWLAGAIAGAAYGGLYMWSGNLWIPVLSHVVTNGALGVWILYTRNWHFW
jgi:hypothetical protein